MNSKMWFLGVLAAVLVAGCIEDEAEDEAEKDFAQCHIRTCIADPDGVNAVQAMQRYNLHQVTGDGYNKFSPRVDGDLVVWQSSRRVNDSLSSDVYGFNAVSRELFVIGADDFVHQILPQVSQGNVVYSESPGSQSSQGYEPAYLVLWNASSQEKHRLDIPLVGSKGPSSFDYPWVLFHNRGAPNPEEEGLYAYNVEDERLVQIYIPYPNGEKPDGSFEIIRGEAVADGHAFYAVFQNDFNETTNSTIYDVNLETGDQQEVYFGEDWQLNTLDASSRYVVWEQVTDFDFHALFMLDVESLNVVSLVNQAGMEPAHPRVQGEWVIYDYDGPFNGTQIHGWMGYHVPSQTTHALVVSDRHLGLDLKLDTDGTKLAGVTYRLSTEFFETQGWDVYWKPLPSVG